MCLVHCVCVHRSSQEYITIFFYFFLFLNICEPFVCFCLIMVHFFNIIFVNLLVHEFSVFRTLCGWRKIGIFYDTNCFLKSDIFTLFTEVINFFFEIMIPISRVVISGVNGYFLVELMAIF